MLVSCLRVKRGVVLAMLLSASTAAFADNSKISPDLLPLISSNPSASVNVIIQYNSPPQTCTVGLLGGLLCTTVDLLGGVVQSVIGLINAVTGTLTGTQILNLSNDTAYRSSASPSAMYNPVGRMKVDDGVDQGGRPERHKDGDVRVDFG